MLFCSYKRGYCRKECDARKQKRDAKPKECKCSKHAASNSSFFKSKLSEVCGWYPLPIGMEFGVLVRETLAIRSRPPLLPLPRPLLENLRRSLTLLVSAPSTVVPVARVSCRDLSSDPWQVQICGVSGLRYAVHWSVGTILPSSPNLRCQNRRISPDNSHSIRAWDLCA